LRAGRATVASAILRDEVVKVRAAVEPRGVEAARRLRAPMADNLADMTV
jgi:hypothetical protein